jgi:nucleotide-binding universal stress UspA family protein
MSWVPRKTVVVPVDFSDESLEAVETARLLVSDASHLHVIHVLAALEGAEPVGLFGTVDEDARQRHAEQSLRERLAKPELAGINIVITFGDPGHEVTDYAQKVGADLIVMPSHGRTGIRRLLIGSVAERVVRLAHCPVLVLKK